MRLGLNLKTYKIGNGEYLPVRTKTGKEIHLASGSATICGVWLKANASYFYANHEITCEKCKIFMENVQQ